MQRSQNALCNCKSALAKGFYFFFNQKTDIFAELFLHFVIMIHIKVIDREGTIHNLEAPTDMNMNLMELCKAYELPVEGTCGGMAMCASCQVYVESNHELPAKSNDEEDMLDQAFHVEDNSRLGCQVYLKDELDGLKIRLAREG